MTTTSEETIVYLDTETGGLTPEHSTLQIGMVVDIDDEQRIFSSYVGGDRLVIDPVAMAYNGIDLRQAADWPWATRAANLMDSWIVSTDLIWRLPIVACGFNVRFDVARANKLYEANRTHKNRSRELPSGAFGASSGPLFSHHVLDLTSIARFHGLPCKSKELIEWAGFPDEIPGQLVDPHIAQPVDRWLALGPHDALYDALAAKAVHKKMMAEFLEESYPR